MESQTQDVRRKEDLAELKTLAAVILVLAGAAVLSAEEADEPEANPGRPTVSTPAAVAPTGYLQFETGGLTARHSPEFSSRSSAVEVMKLSVSPRLEFLASFEPLVHYRTEGRKANGTAEVFLGAQAVLHQGEGARPTVAVSYFRRIYDGGAPDLDFGSPRNSLVVLASAEVRGFHYDANGMVNEITQGAVRRAQFAQTLSVSHGMGRGLSISGELWHFSQPFLRRDAVGNLWALAYAARKNLVFDAGFDRGLTGTSTRWEVFAGFTYLLPRRAWH